GQLPGLLVVPGAKPVGDPEVMGRALSVLLDRRTGAGRVDERGAFEERVGNEVLQVVDLAGPAERVLIVALEVVEEIAGLAGDAAVAPVAADRVGRVAAAVTEVIDGG